MSKAATYDVASSHNDTGRNGWRRHATGTGSNSVSVSGFSIPVAHTSGPIVNYTGTRRQKYVAFSLFMTWSSDIVNDSGRMC